MMSFSLVWLF